MNGELGAPDSGHTSPQEGLPVGLEQVFATGTVRDEHGELRRLAGNVTRDEAIALFEIARGLRPTTSVEIGCAQGVSTVAILKALADARHGVHHVLDPYQRQYGNCGIVLARDAGVSGRMVFHESFAEEVVPTLAELQFAFIDSSHLFDLTMSEFVLIDKKLVVGGVIGFHDLWMPSLQKVLRYVLANRAYELLRSIGEYNRPRAERPTAKSIVAGALRCLPRRCRRWVAPEALAPWSTLGIENLVFIRKLEPDRRQWTFHREF